MIMRDQHLVQDGPHLTSEELAKRWGYEDPHAIHQMRHKGTAPVAMKINGRLLFRVKDVVAYEKAHETLNTSVGV